MVSFFLKDCLLDCLHIAYYSSRLDISVYDIYDNSRRNIDVKQRLNNAVIKKLLGDKQTVQGKSKLMEGGIRLGFPLDCH